MGDTKVHASHGVSLLVSPEDFVSVIGTSGSGKSTLMKIQVLLDAALREKAS